jgi:hypothetical protein
MQLMDNVKGWFDTFSIDQLDIDFMMADGNVSTQGRRTVPSLAGHQSLSKAYAGTCQADRSALYQLTPLVCAALSVLRLMPLAQ